MSKLKATCKECGKEFIVRKYQLKIGTGKYCSHKCAAKNQKIKPLEERFLEKIDKKGVNECWEFTGFKNKDGYGKMSNGNSILDSAHRISYKLYKGDIPEGMVVMHTCDNPSCCNPNHLVLGTQNDNIQDMMKKKRFVKHSGSKASKFTDERILEIRNKYTGKRGEKLKLSKEYKCSPTTITNILNDWK